MTADTLHELQAAILATQAAALDAAVEHPNDPLLAAFWQKLNDLGEMVDMWRLRESEVGHG